MREWLGIIVILSLCVACNGNSQKSPEDSKSSKPAPIESSSPSPSTPALEETYSTEVISGKLVVRFGDQIISEIEGGQLIGASRKFVAYQSGNTSVLLGKDGVRIYSCSAGCLMNVTGSFASVQSASGDSVLFNANSEKIQSCTQVECEMPVTDCFAAVIRKDDRTGSLIDKNGSTILSFDVPSVVKLSNRFAAVMNRKNADLFFAGKANKIDKIYGCTSVDCDISVSNGFAAVLSSNGSSGSLFDHNGETIYSFSDVKGHFKLSDAFAAVEFRDGGTLYHVTEGHVYSAHSVPVRFTVTNDGSTVSDKRGISIRFDKNGYKQ